MWALWRTDNLRIRKMQFLIFFFRFAILQNYPEGWSLASSEDWTVLNCAVLKDLEVSSELWVLRCFHAGKNTSSHPGEQLGWVMFPWKGKAQRKAWEKRAWNKSLITAYQFLLHLESRGIDELAEDPPTREVKWGANQTRWYFPVIQRVVSAVDIYSQEVPWISARLGFWKRHTTVRWGVCSRASP